jgi:hypothetical protein
MKLQFITTKQNKTKSLFWQFQQVLFFACCLLTHVQGYAQDSICNSAKKDSLVLRSPKTAKNLTYGALPTLYYTPETRLAYGGFVFAYFHVDKTDTAFRKSNAQLYFTHTQNRQYSVEIDWLVFGKKEQWLHSGTFDVLRFPEYFYNIGNGTPETDRHLITFDVIRLESEHLKNIGNRLFLGLKYQTQYLFDMQIDDSPLNLAMFSEKISGGSGYLANGLGGSLVADHRNNPLTPTKGFYVEASILSFSKLTFSTHNFTTVMLDIRKYIALKPRWTLAFNGYLALSNGNIPFRMNPTLGGGRFLRGYYRGRFRDKNLFVAQAELRFPLFWRFGAVAFSGIGDVGNDLSNFGENGLKYSYGTGLRFKLNKKEDANLRIDYGITPEGGGLYIVFAEAF